MTAIRDHVSHRPSRARVELELRRSLRPLAIVLAGLALALAGLAYIAVHLPGHGGLTKTVTVRFTVADASGVVPGRDEVRVSGIPAGTISAVELHHGHAVLTAKVDRKYGPIYRDARAQLRPNTPIQDMYLDIVDRGTAASGPADARRPLPEDRTTSSVAIGDVLQMFDADTRARLRTTLAEFGRGLDGEGASVRNAFVSLTPLLDVAHRLTTQIARRREMTRRLVDNTATLTEELGSRQAELRRFVDAAGGTLGALESGAHGLDATLAEMPPTLAALGRASDALGGALPDVDAAVARLGPVAAALPASLGSLRRLSATARPALDALQPAVSRVRPLVHELRPASARLAGAVGALAPQTADIDHVTRTLGRCTYVLQRFFQWTQSVFATGDSHGVAPRGDAAVTLDSTGLNIEPHTSKYPSNCGGGTTIGGVPAGVVHP